MGYGNWDDDILGCMELIEPSMDYAESFEEAVLEFKGEPIHGFNMGTPFTTVADAIDRMEQSARGENLPEGWVPSHTYWLIDDQRVIGIVNIRHYLTPALEKRNGHIGYSIRPSEQKKGYGTELLRLALQKAKELGIHRALLTCDENNLGSRRIIEKNGGELQDIIEVDGDAVMRFWIENP